MAYFIIGTIVVGHKYFLILAYVVGKGIGTYAGMKINLEKDHE
jgi:glycerol-3-phosphate acyltransferase PlsY